MINWVLRWEDNNAEFYKYHFNFDKILPSLMASKMCKKKEFTRRKKQLDFWNKCFCASMGIAQTFCQHKHPRGGQRQRHKGDISAMWCWHRRPFHLLTIYSTTVYLMQKYHFMIIAINLWMRISLSFCCIFYLWCTLW